MISVKAQPWTCGLSWHCGLTLTQRLVAATGSQNVWAISRNREVITRTNVWRLGHQWLCGIHWQNVEFIMLQVAAPAGSSLNLSNADEHWTAEKLHTKRANFENFSPKLFKVRRAPKEQNCHGSVSKQTNPILPRSQIGYRLNEKFGCMNLFKTRILCSITWSQSGCSWYSGGQWKWWGSERGVTWMTRRFRAEALKCHTMEQVMLAVSVAISTSHIHIGISLRKNIWFQFTIWNSIF
jgi:hypothetical protein